MPWWILILPEVNQIPINLKQKMWILLFSKAKKNKQNLIYSVLFQKHHRTIFSRYKKNTTYL